MRRTDSAREFVPNLAPMVDVIMVLLVFFMLGASMNLITQGVLETELDPRSGPGLGAAVEIVPQVQIALTPGGPATPEPAGASVGDTVPPRGPVHISLMGQPLPENTFTALQKILRARLQAGADPDNMVVIAAEATICWQDVVSAMDAAVAAGFRNVQFAVSFRAAPAAAAPPPRMSDPNPLALPAGSE